MINSGQKFTTTNYNKIIWVYISVISIAILLIYIYLFAYIHPQLDDYDNTLLLNDLGIIGFIKHWYYEWTGRYTTVGIYALAAPYNSGSIIWYRISTFLLFAFFVSSLLFLWTNLIGNILNRFAPYAATLISFLIFTYSLPEPTVFYWFSSSATYLLGLGFLLCFAGSMIMYFKTQRKRWLVLIILTATATIGTNEITAISLFVFYCIYLLLKLLRTRRIGTPELTALIIITIAILTTLLAPGNFNRNEKLLLTYNKPFDIYWAAIKSTYYTALQYWLGFKNIPLLCLSLLAIPYLQKINTIYKAKYKVVLPHPIISLAIGITSYFIIIFVFFFIFGYTPAARSLTVYWFLFLVGWVYFLFSVADWLQKYNYKIFEISGNVVLKTILSVIFTVGLILPWSQINDASKTLFSGEAECYSKSVNQRYDLMESTVRKGTKGLILIPTLKCNPRFLLFEDIKEKPEVFNNKSFAAYYNLDSVAVFIPSPN